MAIKQGPKKGLVDKVNGAIDNLKKELMEYIEQDTLISTKSPKKKKSPTIVTLSEIDRRNVDRIVARVAAVFNISENELLNDRETDKFAVYLCIYFVKNFTRLSQTNIAEKFGRSKGSIEYAVNQIANLNPKDRVDGLRIAKRDRLHNYFTKKL
jgi:chromosomal replication initiation ATPase DnaA